MGMMGGSSGSMVRHHQFMMGGVPEAYRSLTDPLPVNTEVISRGRAIYRDHCASCHGLSGLGDARTIAETRKLGVAFTHADDDGRLLPLLDDRRRWCCFQPTKSGRLSAFSRLDCRHPDADPDAPDTPGNNHN
jgi:hypothetical protein